MRLTAQGKQRLLQKAFEPKVERSMLFLVALAGMVGEDVTFPRAKDLSRLGSESSSTTPPQNKILIRNWGTSHLFEADVRERG